MNHVDLESRYGSLTLRLAPAPHPDGPQSPAVAWAVRTLNQGLELSLVTPEDPDAPQTLIELFEEIDAEQRGWDGPKQWESRFGALKIVATHDQINAVILKLDLRGGIMPQWTAQAEIHLDPGRFNRVAANLKLYVEQLPDEVEDEAAASQPVGQRRSGHGIRDTG